MLLRGEYEKVIDSCKLILSVDSLNSEILYKMGIACQNLMYDEASMNYFNKAAEISPDNKIYSFALAKGYYGKGKHRLAEPILFKLCALDSMNWSYAYYLTSILMQSGKFDDAIKIYKRFSSRDTTNYIYLDKLAYATMKKDEYDKAIELYNKSLSVNQKDLTALKNLSFLYASTLHADTAIQLLTRGIQIDSTDMDLYLMRANLNYSLDYRKRALDDYLVLLSSGDSSKLYLKRIGIGYSYNLQPDKAIIYLLKAYKADSSDYETCSFLGQCYFKTKDMGKSALFYEKVIKILVPVETQLGFTYSLCAGSQKANEEYMEAIASYQKAYKITGDPEINMLIANLYDEKLNNKQRAITYYQRFLNAQKTSKRKYPTEYIEKIEKRLEFLRKPPSVKSG